MIWIASYPRSGNTFMRNLFFDVFGLESASWPRERNYVQGKEYRVTKTHMLPHQVTSLNEKDVVIYLIRDGRDSIVSNAHYRKNFIDRESDFNDNIRENILALRGSYFGGWSANAAAWSKRANLIIRFEDLVRDPVKALEQIRALTPLPDPDYSRIKSFEELKFGTPQYGSGGNGLDRKAFAENFFHKGTAGQFKSEMPEALHELFWHYHGDVMNHFGYTRSGDRKEYHFAAGQGIRREIPLRSRIIISYYSTRLFWDLLKSKGKLLLKGENGAARAGGERIQKPQTPTRIND